MRRNPPRTTVNLVESIDLRLVHALQIDGRAPVSIMTCNVQPDDPQLASWLGEGLSLEVHTVDHP